MTKYTGRISNFLQGVSQQPEFARRPEELEKVINCRSSVVDGLGNRPGTYYIDAIGTTAEHRGNAFHHYDRGDTEESYLFSVGDGSIKIYDIITGTEKTVATPDGVGYLAATNPESAFKFYTKADTTFLLNTEITVATTGTTAASTIWQRLLYCKQVNFGATYYFYVDGVEIASFTAPTSGALSTGDVIAGLATDIETWATGESVTFEHDNDVIYLTKATGTYNTNTKDGNNGRDLFCIGNEIGEFSNLSSHAKNGYKVKVTGLDESGYNDYYVQFETENSLSIGYGIWKESAGFGVDTQFDYSTMPMTVTREAGGTFTLEEIDWVSRTAGDDDSNPLPSFVGHTISDLTIYQGRLVFSSNENIAASVVFDFFNFFAPSVLRVSEDDPIDVASSDSQVTNLHNIVLFNSALVCFSDTAQFLHPGDRGFSNRTFSLSSKAKYPSSSECSPVVAGSSIYFPYSFGVYSGVREIKYDPFTGNLASQPITEHVTKFIEGTVKQIQASTGYSKLFVRSETDDYGKTIQLYEWYSTGEELLQTAWSEWQFAHDILYIGVLRNSLYIIMDTGTDVAITRMSLADEDSTGVDFPVRMDMMEEVQGVPNYAENRWELTSDVYNYLDDIKVVAGAGTNLPGEEVLHGDTGELYTISAELQVLTLYEYWVNPVYVEEGYDEIPDLYFWVGEPFESDAVITNPFIRDGSGDIRDEARFRIGTMTFNLNKTGAVTLYCTKGGSTFEKTYRGRILDSVGEELDVSPDISDRKLKLSVRSDRSKCVIGIKSTDFLPFNVLSADWYGTYSSSGRRSR
jgi:hypothetical protein